MKKTLLISKLMLVFLLFTAWNVSAQDYYFSESFATGALPSGWDSQEVSFSSSDVNAANVVDPTAEYCAKMKTDESDSWIQFPKVESPTSLAFWCKVKNPIFNPIVAIQSSTDGLAWGDLVSSTNGITGLDMTDSTIFQEVILPLTIVGEVYIRIYVSADGGTSADGMLSVDDIRLERPAAAADDASLRAIYIGGSMIDDFNISTTSYNLIVEADDDITVTAEATNLSASVQITQATNITGTEAERTATIVATSVDASTTSTTTIIFLENPVKYHFETGFPSGSLPDGWSGDNFAVLTPGSNSPNQTFPDETRVVKMKVSDPVTSWLQLPSVSGAGDLIFWCKVKNSGTLAAKLQTSTDGTNWTDHAATIAGLDLANTDDFQNITIPLNIEDIVYLRFYIYTSDGVSTSDALYLDDFQLTKLPAKNDDASLATLYVGDNMMKGFNFQVFEYDSIVSLVEDYTISAEATSLNATVTITQVSDILGSEAERTATVVVTSEDETVSSTTTIVFTQENYLYKTGFYSNEGLEGWNRNKVFQDQTPNYPSTDLYPGEGNLKFTGGHSTGNDPIAGHLVSPYLKNVGTLTFWASAEVVFAEHELNIYAKYSDTDSTLVKSITGTDLTVAWQEVEVVIESEDSVQIRIEAICDINDDKTSRIWVDDFLLTYYEAPLITADNATLKGLYVGGIMIDNFDAATTSYTMEVTAIQNLEVTAETMDVNASAVITQASNLYGDEAARTATVVVTSADASVTATTTVVFTRNTTGVESFEATEVAFYPNPARDFLNIQMTGNSYQRLEIFNMIGQVVMNETLIAEQMSINVDALQKGIYIMSFTGEAGTYTAKFIKE